MTANKNHSMMNKNQEELDEQTSLELQKLGKFISNLRRGKGLKQHEVWQEITSSEPVYQRIEQGKKNLKYSELYKIAKFYGISVAELFKLQEQGRVLVNSGNNIGDNSSYANIGGVTTINEENPALTQLQQSFTLLHRQLEETQRRLEALEKEQQKR